ncbi:hypothetical protein [Rickettsia hoogstraalii]|uniref:hypothetical protein n=1 Tax=Rickettsia hoogstraalii TaxID=467174 RepID=UPI000591728C|nr:hypothetical protein [Rickettsia hoogstraalii]
MEYELGELIENAKKLQINETSSIDNNFFDFQNLVSDRKPLNEIITSKVYEGGIGEYTRFNCLSKVIGYWLRDATMKDLLHMRK